MKANRAIINKANRVIAKHTSGLRYPEEIVAMYDELHTLGITVGMITGDCKRQAARCEWYLNGEQVDNSYFIYQAYDEPSWVGRKKEFTIYLS